MNRIIKQGLLAAFLTFTVTSQSACAATNDPSASESEFVIGEISSTQLLAQEKRFNRGYQSFEPSAQELKLLASLPEGAKVKVYFGSWCHDSQREVPRMIKLLENTKAKLWLYGLPISKSDAQGFAKAAGVKYTPTFVVSYNGKELGRIIERPKSGSLAQDIANMF